MFLNKSLNESSDGDNVERNKKEPSFITSFLYCLWFKAVGGRAVLLNLFDDVHISRGKTCLAVHLKWNRKVNVLLQNFNS